MSGDFTTSPGSSADTGRIEEIHYSLEPEDYADYMRFCTRRQPQAPWRQLGAYTFYCAVALTGFAASLLHSPDPLSPYFLPQSISQAIHLGFAGYFFYVMVLNLLLITGLMPRRFFESRVETNYQTGLLKRGQRQRVWMTADEFVEVVESEQKDGDGVVIEGRTESRALWSAVERIDETKEYFFFKMAEKGYLVVPKRVFPDEAAARRYLETVESLREAYLRRLAAPFAGTEARDPNEVRPETINLPGNTTSPPR